jgi:hypothetical protein
MDPHLGLVEQRANFLQRDVETECNVPVKFSACCIIRLASISEPQLSTELSQLVYAPSVMYIAAPTCQDEAYAAGGLGSATGNVLQKPSKRSELQRMVLLWSELRQRKDASASVRLRWPFQGEC